MSKPVNVVAAATTNSTLVKAGRGRVTGLVLTNAHASAIRYVKLYNKVTAPTVGTDTPVMTVAIPAASAINVELGRGIEFSAGIGFGITGAAAVADTTAVVAGDVVGTILYV